MDEERVWLVIWGAVIGAGITAEVIALRTGKPHAPLSHYLRYVPLKGPLGKAALMAGAWILHEHLHPRQKPA